MGIFRIDPLMLKLIITVLLASLLPARGHFIDFFEWLTTAAIALLFFMHGAKLSREKIIAGGGHWRLHLWVMFSTFVLFPALGAILVWWHPLPLSHEIYSGFMYLTILPATVQSSIALTSLAGGNVAAAVCSASASSLLGVFISPLLVSLLMNVHSNVPGGSLEQIGKIMLQLLVPFVVGHLSRRWIANWVERNRGLISKTDQASILLVVYSAFSEAVVNGIWHRVGVMTLVWIVAGSLGLLFVVLAINLTAARLFGFNRADEITLLFCGSKKSLANGVPMANILFPSATVGIVVLPLMIFHQVQLMVCSMLAQRYRKTGEKQIVAHEESGSRALARSRKAR
ncbi:bile acid:sodium symporter [Erwinia amylovora]|uniref:bile acid:sodium symporter family protein n=1 Tax=Erwinia amylovora TaxID=552 RepID=UPI000C089593|nr:bile acid:sodium symporter family protein [Erwinia amylovora]MBZ2400814.1 bile acid:sodium symporter [Erwinia amylovora]MBZ2404307.1 bile acid:sodium symporter [Erwinia amylovora]UDJ85705.1 bile acid:sodium symporter [Erwinia amylovora]UDK00348.1 bile acid:sodium symporter [Erwinia amylovora]UDK90766.1 bile acid:sodium symporter [Erwinia amylovora]